MIAGGDYYYFFTPKGGDYSREGNDYFKYYSMAVVPKICCFIISLNQKIITSNKLTILWGFQVFQIKYGSLINLHSLNCHWSVLLDQTPLQLDRDGTGPGGRDKKRGDGKRGGGNCLTEVFDWGTAIIQEIWYCACPNKIPPSDKHPQPCLA